MRTVNPDYEINELIKKRWSPRAFSQKSVEEETLNRLFEAARWAPSSFNEQPWRFIAIRKENNEEFEKVLSVLTGRNPEWAGGAAVFILTLAKKTLSRNGKLNRHALHDLGLAVGNLTVQAAEMDLYLHQLGGFNNSSARDIFSIDDDFELSTIIALGYLGDPEILPEDLRQKEFGESKRKPITEFAEIR
ncbi:MAG: nitroreductase family protein [Melioribacteraceae bacterium]|nr:nitroreductase family protein [Melioribacteraceae bacterium]